MWSDQFVLHLAKTPDGYRVEDESQIYQPPCSEIDVPFPNPQFEVDPISIDPDFKDEKPFPGARIPSTSCWFDSKLINQIEKESLPEFFSGKYPSKTPMTYMHFRNFIIRSYRENTKQYLTATACRRALVGDACAIVRLHSFLEKWGLINFEIDPGTRPQPLYQVILQPKTQEILTQAELKFCGYCGEPCSEIWYTHEMLNLCAKCFGESNIPMILSQDDFTKQTSDPVLAQVDSVISLPLLQSTFINKDNWDKTAEELDKSASQCLWEFLQLPINEIGDLKLGTRSYEIPSGFGDIRYPLLSQIADALNEKDLESTEAPSSPRSQMDEIKERAQKYREMLEEVNDARSFLANQDYIIQKTKAEFLLSRIESARNNKLSPTSKIFVLKAPKYTNIS